MTGRIATPGNVQYAVVLTVQAVDGYVSMAGDEFTMFSHGSYPGAFSSVEPVGFGAHQSLQLNYLNPALTVAVSN